MSELKDHRQIQDSSGVLDLLFAFSNFRERGQGANAKSSSRGGTGVVENPSPVYRTIKSGKMAQSLIPWLTSGAMPFDPSPAGQAIGDLPGLPAGTIGLLMPDPVQ
jgi:hypothetical protein